MIKRGSRQSGKHKAGEKSEEDKEEVEDKTAWKQASTPLQAPPSQNLEGVASRAAATDRNQAGSPLGAV